MIINLTKLLNVSCRVSFNREIKYGETGWVGVSSTQTTAKESGYAFDLEEESNE